MSVATMMRCFWKRILKRTGDFEGHARMSKVNTRVGMIYQGLCRVQMVLPRKNGPRKTEPLQLSLCIGNRDSNWFFE